MRPLQAHASRKLLVITYHFPPDGTVGGQRWAGLAKYLARAGWEVHVVTASPPSGAPLPPGVHTHFGARRRTLNDLYKSTIAARRSANGVAQPPKPEGGHQRKNTLLQAMSAVRRIASSSIGMPDHGRGWVARAAGIARALMRDMDFDCVVTSGPPHSAHIAGLAAVWGSRTPFWIDMRDPWSLTYEMNTAGDAFIRAERKFLRALEKLVFPRAARVLVNTREFASTLRNSDPDVKVTYFPNGIDMEELPSRDTSTIERGTIAYVGTLYAGRTLSSVFGAMRSIVNDSPSAANSLKLNVAGPLESPHRERMLAEIEAGGLTSLVKVHGILPRAGALQLLSRANLALVLAQDQPMCVPAKLYESVGLGVPTLVIAEKNSAAACEARRIGAMTVEVDDEAGIKLLIGEMLSGRMPAHIQAKTPISYQDLAVEMDRLICESVFDQPPLTQPATESVAHFA